jgi:hypothetical protein
MTDGLQRCLEGAKGLLKMVVNESKAAPGTVGSQKESTSRFLAASRAPTPSRSTQCAEYENNRNTIRIIDT